MPGTVRNNTSTGGCNATDRITDPRNHNMIHTSHTSMLILHVELMLAQKGYWGIPLRVFECASGRLGKTGWVLNVSRTLQPLFDRSRDFPKRASIKI